MTQPKCVLDTNVLISRLLMAHSILSQRDDKFLEVAVNGAADVIITGDRDLLALHPFMEIPILTPKDYMAQFR